jgi:transcriptional antiterminator RfaH
VSWSPVRSTLRVVSLVRFSGRIAEVSPDLIESLRSAAKDTAVFHPLFQQGQRVRIVAGEFATLEAVFDVAEGEARAAVLLDLLGRQNRVKVRVDDLVAAL